MLDSIAAMGYGARDDDPPERTTPDESTRARRVFVTRASSVRMAVTRWTWEGRLPVGALSLIGGREGIGKSLTLVSLCADLTKGTLPGAYWGSPRAVVYQATEDDWARTVAPRLVAAGANLDLVYRLDVDIDGLPSSLVLPLDTEALRRQVEQLGAVLVAVDPLVSVLDSKINTHQDSETRRALEPLARMAADTSATVVGLVHHGKSMSTDALSLVLGSRAFTAVSRSVLAAVRDPEAEDGSVVLGLVKNNLGRLNLPSLRYRVNTAQVATPEGLTDVGALEWLGEEEVDLADLIRGNNGDGEERGERDDAADWLRTFLEHEGGEAAAKAVKFAAKLADISESTLKRARIRAGVVSDRTGFPATAVWRLPVGPQLGQLDQATDPEPTGPTGDPTGAELIPDVIRVRLTCAVCSGALDSALAGECHPTCVPASVQQEAAPCDRGAVPTPLDVYRQRLKPMADNAGGSLAWTTNSPSRQLQGIR